MREFAVTGIRLIAATDGRVIAASQLGKLKTVTQIVAIIMIQLAMGTEQWIGHMSVWSGFNVLADIALIISIVMAVISGVEYFAKNKQLLH